MTSHLPSYHGYRFPPDIISHAVWLYISHAVWLYHRFGLSFRDVEDLLAQTRAAWMRACGPSTAPSRRSTRA